MTRAAKRRLRVPPHGGRWTLGSRLPSPSQHPSGAPPCHWPQLPKGKGKGKGNGKRKKVIKDHVKPPRAVYHRSEEARARRSQKNKARKEAATTRFQRMAAEQQVAAARADPSSTPAGVAWALSGPKPKSRRGIRALARLQAALVKPEEDVQMWRRLEELARSPPRR